MGLTSLHDFYGLWHLYTCCSLLGHSTNLLAAFHPKQSICLLTSSNFLSRFPLLRQFHTIVSSYFSTTCTHLGLLTGFVAAIFNCQFHQAILLGCNTNLCRFPPILQPTLCRNCFLPSLALL